MRSNLLIQQTSEIFAHLFKFPKISEKGIDYNVILYTSGFFHPMLILSLHTYKFLCPVLNSPGPGFVSIQKHWNSPCLKCTHWQWRWKGEKNQTWSKYFSIYSICLSLSCLHFFITIMKKADGFVHLVLSYTILLHLGPIWGMRLFEISQHVTYNAYRSSQPPPNPQLWLTLILHPTFVFVNYLGSHLCL